MSARFRSSANLSLGDVAILKNMGRDEVIRIDRITQRDRAMPFDYEGRSWSARLGIVQVIGERAEFEVLVLQFTQAGYILIRIAVRNYSLHSRSGELHEGDEIQSNTSTFTEIPTRIAIILTNDSRILFGDADNPIFAPNQPATED